MSTELSLRGWQTRFVESVRRHQSGDYLLVACPAAGKTRAAGVAAAALMQARKCDQLVVICPTVVVRDQWMRELAELGFSMLDDYPREGWPEYVHGVVATYATLVHRSAQFAEQVRKRRTVAVLDEIHHVGSERSWGERLREAFGEAVFRLKTTGTPFRSDEDTIPFIRYDADGRCVPDFGYDYSQAVREGVCRRVKFYPHDGLIVWRTPDDIDAEGRFSDDIPRRDESRRLRASLDPSKLYLRSLLYAANHDLSKLRRKVPTAGGLVVADSQAHALAIDPILTEICGESPVLAMSDLPRSHKAIEAFADEDTRWLLSVRMVSEGVDLPRLGVIVWATAATTELMVRQVSGRALRGRAEYARLPAIVHMPADPDLVHYAEQLEVLGGISRSRKHDRQDDRGRHVGRHGWQGGHRAKSIDPTPFVRWFDRMSKGLSTEEMCRRCGWSLESGARRVNRWRHGEYGDPLMIFDACHMAGVSFYELFKAKRYAGVRAWLEDPTVRDVKPIDFGSVDAQPVDDEPEVIEPNIPMPKAALHSEEMVSVSTPALPPSPKEIRAKRDRARAKRSELLRLLNTYAALQRMVNPAYQGAMAHVELARDVGRVGPDTPERKVDEAIGWVRDRLRLCARQHPEEFMRLAAMHRRQELSRGADRTDRRASRVA